MLLRSGLPVGCRFNSPRNISKRVCCDGRSVQMAEKGLLFLVRAVKFSSPYLNSRRWGTGLRFGRPWFLKGGLVSKLRTTRAWRFFCPQARRPFSPCGKIPAVRKIPSLTFFDLFRERWPPDQTEQFSSRNFKPSSLVWLLRWKLKFLAFFDPFNCCLFLNPLWEYGNGKETLLSYWYLRSSNYRFVIQNTIEF